VKIDYDGQVWDFDLLGMEMPLCEAVEKYVGKGLGEWGSQLAAGSVKSLTALWWVMRKQAGQDPGPVGQPGEGFRPVRLLLAFLAAAQADAEAEAEAEAAAQAEAEAEPDPTPPPASSPASAATPTTPAAAPATLSLPG